MYSHVRYVRIVAPAHRAKERAEVSEVRRGDTIEIPDHPLRRVDPVTRKATDQLQRFTVTDDGDLSLS